MKIRSYSKRKIIAFTEKMEADMRFFCRNKGIKSESELVRKAVAYYIYANKKNETPDRHILNQLQDILSRCQLSISFK
jgi:metal-responsive CopG/Arc/MetJ family transcriptional regulator